MLASPAPLPWPSKHARIRADCVLVPVQKRPRSRRLGFASILGRQCSPAATAHGLGMIARERANKAAGQWPRLLDTFLSSPTAAPRPRQRRHPRPRCQLRCCHGCSHFLCPAPRQCRRLHRALCPGPLRTLRSAVMHIRTLPPTGFVQALRVIVQPPPQLSPLGLLLAHGSPQSDVAERCATHPHVVEAPLHMGPR